MNFRQLMIFGLGVLIWSPLIARGEGIRTEQTGVVTLVEGVASELRALESGSSVLTAIESKTGATLREVSHRHGLATEVRRYVQYAGDLEVIGGGAVIRFDSNGNVTGFDGRIAMPDHVARALESATPIYAASLTAGSIPSTVPPRQVLLIEGERLIRALEVRVEEQPLREALHYYDSSGSLLRRVALWYEAGREVSIFPSNPVTRLNDPSLRDDNDAPSAVPPAAYDRRVIEIDESGTTFGTARVKISELDAPSTTAVDPDLPELAFDRSDQRFEEVMSVWHIDRSLEYLESLGYTGTRQVVNQPISVDAHGNNGGDNSFYAKRTTGPILVFGDGGVDDAEDPDIILHELGHAIHDGLAPSALSGTPSSDARAISEGFADYWAFSEGWSASIEGGRDPFCIGDWDARCGSGPSSGCSYPAGADCLRRVDVPLVLAELDRGGRSGSEHQNGRMWSSLLREIFLGLTSRYGPEQGKQRSDTLVIEGLIGLPYMPSFSQSIERLLDADDTIYGGGARNLICSAASPRGVHSDRCPPLWRGTHTVFMARSALIPASGMLRSTHWVPLEGTVRDLRVTVRITHPSLKDLEISIVAPDGSSFLLARRGSLSGMELDRTFGLDLPAATPLALLEGKSLQGEWTLVIRSSSTQTGALSSWSLSPELEEDAPLTRAGAGNRVALIPAAGHTRGANGTHWITDLTIRNLTSSPHRVAAILTPAGTDGNESAMIARIFIEPAQTLTIRDVVRGIFGFEGACSIELRGPSRSITATSRTYNDSSSGTFGQAIPSYRSPTLSAESPTLFLPGMRENLDFRSNVGFTETSGRDITFSIDLLDASGVPIGTTRITFLPWEHRQISIRNLANNFDAGMARLRHEEGEGSLAAYASIIDNRTGDPIYIPLVKKPEAEARIIPVVAHLDGAGGSKWRSDIYISNPSEEPKSITIEYRSTSGARVGTITGTVGPLSSAFVDDVLQNWFAVAGGGQLEITPGDVIVSSRTWNDGRFGSFGQHVPTVERSEGIAAIGSSGSAIGVEQTTHFRTNIGMVEITGDFAVFDVTVYGDSGAMLCTSRFGLGPREQRQVSLPSIGCKQMPGGYVVMTKVSGGGSAVGWASMVDNRSGDPVFVPITGALEE